MYLKVWKQALSDTENQLAEQKELLKTSLVAVAKLEVDCDNWKTKSAKYKELAARGHRMGEKRASICVQQTPPSCDALSQTQLQLERERTAKSELMKRIQKLEDQLQKSESEYSKRLEEEERHWISQSNERECEYQEKISYLEDKILQQKENRIKVIIQRKVKNGLVFLTIFLNSKIGIGR